MRIALLGYGKMGKAIETIAIERGHTIALKVSSSSESLALQNCDVAIDFSLPTSAFAWRQNAFVYWWNDNGIKI